MKVKGCKMNIQPPYSSPFFEIKGRSTAISFKKKRNFTSQAEANNTTTRTTHATNAPHRTLHHLSLGE
jgi:hypothetical protein